MFSFFNPYIGFAALSDISAIKVLLNIAYRGESSKQGWTTEALLIGGDTRANDVMVKEVIQKAGSVILIYKKDKILGCVNLQQHNDRLYLGMFSVLPALQGGGIGKKLLLAAEEYALHLKCRAIYMSVISLRTELIDWYKRHGYSDTGKRIPFEEDEVTGKHLRPLEFMILEKLLD